MQVFHDHILPFPTSSSSSSTSKSQTQDLDETAWTDRLLLVMKYIDDQSVKALLSISGLKFTYNLFNTGGEVRAN